MILDTKLFSLSFFCAFLGIAFMGCSFESDSHGVERLRFFKKTPPNIKTDYEIIVGDRDAQNYTDIKGPVKFIRQRHYEIAKDAKGNLLPPHFSGITEINYREDGTLADFTYFDSTGVNILQQAFVLHKSSRQEIYLHFAEDNKDFVYLCDKNGRILEQGNDRVYKQSELDHTWNSTDGHFSWEEDANRKIIASHIKIPSGEYRHIYEYDENDSLIQILAFDREGKEKGRYSWKYDASGKLKNASFEYDHKWFRPDILDFQEFYRYDSSNRISTIITTRFDPTWESSTWPPFIEKDTVFFEYHDREGFLEKSEKSLGSTQKSIIYDSYGSAIFIELLGSFIYEGSNGTGETYDVQRLERDIEYYGDSHCNQWPHIDTKSMTFIPVTFERLFKENNLPCYKILLKNSDSSLWKGCFDNREIIQTLQKNQIHAAKTDSLLILGSYQNEKTSLYCLDMQRKTGKLESMDNILPRKKTKKESRNSLSVRDFTRLKPDEAMYLCAPDAGKASASCVILNRFPNQQTINAIENITHKNNSEIFLTEQTAQNPLIFVTHDKCAFVPNSKYQKDQILFNDALITFKKSPYYGFLGDTIQVPLSDLPCHLQ